MSSVEVPCGAGILASRVTPAAIRLARDPARARRAAAMSVRALVGCNGRFGRGVVPGVARNPAGSFAAAHDAAMKKHGSRLEFHRPLVPVAGLLLVLVMVLPPQAWASAARKPPDSTPQESGAAPLAADTAHQAAPAMSKNARPVTFDPKLLRPDPVYAGGYDQQAQLDIYGGKRRLDAPRPLVELGYAMYRVGPIGESATWLGVWFRRAAMATTRSMSFSASSNQ